MPSSWHSLYCPSAPPDLPERLRAALDALGYAAFDPFGLLPGKSYPQSVRLFVAPADASGWRRVLGEPDAALLAHLPFACLWLALEGDAARVRFFESGQERAPLDALPAYLRADVTPDALRRALHDPLPPGDAPTTGLPLDALGADVQQWAGKVDARQAQAIIGRVGADALRKAGGERAAAESLLQNTVQWGSDGGRRIRAVAACLTLPAAWRDPARAPDFVAVRDAYQLRLRKQRLPAARDYPGDAEALARVPDALDYAPVYGGRQPDAGG